jgi:hypothetical protein
VNRVMVPSIFSGQLNAKSHVLTNGMNMALAAIISRLLWVYLGFVSFYPLMSLESEETKVKMIISVGMCSDSAEMSYVILKKTKYNLSHNSLYSWLRFPLGAFA